jgi:hypothetical protein
VGYPVPADMTAGIALSPDEQTSLVK